MAGFASALYLGLSHGSAELRPWRRLTAGAPAALAPPAGSRPVARQLAALLGTEAATLGVSTLHLFWDLGGQLRRRPVRILADEHLYPVGRWGIERAAAAGVPAATFRHHDADIAPPPAGGSGVEGPSAAGDHRRPLPGLRPGAAARPLSGAGRGARRPAPGGRLASPGAARLESGAGPALWHGRGRIAGVSAGSPRRVSCSSPRSPRVSAHPSRCWRARRRPSVLSIRRARR